MRQAKAWPSLFLFALAAINGCSSGPPPKELGLLPHDDAAKREEDERLRRLQMVRVIDVTDPDAPVERQIEPAEMLYYFTNGVCQKELVNGISECGLAIIDYALCGANHLLDIAGTRAVPLELELTFDETRISIPAQTTATNAALTRLAFQDQAPKALYRAVRQLRAAASLPDFVDDLAGEHEDASPCTATDLEKRIKPDGTLDDEAATVEPGSVTIAAALGERAAAAFWTFREAGLRAVDLNLAVADQQRSNPSLSLQIEQGVLGAKLSRMAAAHLLVGGSEGLLGSTKDLARAGLCSVSDLTAQGQRALDVLRDAGVSPVAVLASSTDVSLQNLLNGSASAAVPGGSVKQRFAQRWGYNFETPPKGIDPKGSVADYFHLQPEDFEEARTYLKHEITAFSRSLTAQIEPPPFAGGYRRFAGTAQAPQALPSEYYAALAAYETRIRSNTSDDVPILTEELITNPGETSVLHQLVPPDLARGMDAALSHAALVLNAQSSITDGSIRNDLMTPVATLLAGDARAGRVRMCRSLASVQETVTFTVGGFKGTDGLAIVRGEDGLRCAVDGTIEGARKPCEDKFAISTMAPIVPIQEAYKLADLNGTGAAMLGFNNSASGSFTFPTYLDGSRLYVVQRRPGASSTPGSYKVLAGIHLEYPTHDTCFETPIVPEVSQRLAAIMAPNPQWCASSQVTCAGTAFDERLPLEDELSSDGDGVESSWRHYLELAKQAAAQSDALGQDYLASGLEYDTRLESGELRDDQKEQLAQDRAIEAVNALQDVCGTAIDPVRLLKLLSTGTDQNDLSLIRDSQVPPCATGYKQILGQCVFDFEQLVEKYRYHDIYSDLARLQSCLSADSVKPFVHLGSKERPVCIWHEINDPRTACKSQDAAHPCPILARETTPGKWDCSNLNPPEGRIVTVKVVNDTLELVDTRRLPTFQRNAAGVTIPVCDEIRSMRSTPNPTYLADLTGSSRFTPLRMTELAKRIQFEARYGSYAAIALDGATRYTTGTAWEAPAATPSWPCAASTLLGCPGPGLFCDVADCSDETQRGRINDRLLRAVIAVNASLGDAQQEKWLAGFVWPEFPPKHMDNPDADVKLEGAVQRDFHVDSETVVPVLEYSSASGPIGPSGVGFAPSPIAAANRAYLYSPEPGFAAPTIVLTDGHPDRQLIFGGTFPILTYQSYRSSQLRPRPGVDKIAESSFDKEKHLNASAYFWDGLSDDGRPPGYYHQHLQHQQNLGPQSLVGLGDTISGSQTLHHLVKFNYEEQAMLDGLELLCQLDEKGSDASNGNCEAPPEVESVADLPAAADSMRCIAGQIARSAATSVLSQFPVDALDPLRRDASISSAAIGGSVGVDVGKLRAALAELADVPILISDQLNQLSAAINGVYLSAQDGDLNKKMADVELESTMANQLATCVAAASPSISATGPSWNPGSVATCANSFAQMGFAEEINSLTRQKAELGVELDLNRFTSTFSTISTSMAQLAHRLSGALNEIDAQLLAIEQQQSRAKLALAKALYVRTFTSQFEAKVNAAHHARFQTARERYQRAHITAQRMAFLAKRAIEMRLGVKLSELTDPLPLVDAPANWESTVCATTGVNYDAVAEGTVTNYADAFIGEYVNKLESVVESYRLVNNFHEGTDAAAISLRDDIHNVRALCETPVGNELFNAGQLHIASTETVPGWDRVGCGTTTSNGEVVPLPDCIGTLEEDAAPVLGVPERSSAPAYRLRFGDLGSCPAATCGYRSGAVLAQNVKVSAGVYRASIYVRDLSEFNKIGFNFALDGVQVTGLAEKTQPASGATWPRVYVVFTVPKVQTLSFGLGRPTLTDMTAADEIVLAAPMLERLSTFDASETQNFPASFANTSDTLTRELPVCEDRDGKVFRNTRWRRGTAQLCPDGFTGNCAGSSARTAGYWETSFSINQRDIESGRILGNSGFAKGNFNYRIDSIAFNFVGTSIRNCSESDAPSTCHAAAFVPYSLIHNGPYTVRNHQGKDFRADLFTGRIESARGLAAERYITSPLSTADRELLSDYRRLELQGRPLDGNFVLRVWDDPSVDFDAMEDVQIILNYRYWTRFN